MIACFCKGIWFPCDVQHTIVGFLQSSPLCKKNTTANSAQFESCVLWVCRRRGRWKMKDEDGCFVASVKLFFAGAKIFFCRCDEFFLQANGERILESVFKLSLICVWICFLGLSEALWGIFTLSRLVNRPLFTAPWQRKSIPKHLSAKLKIILKQILRKQNIFLGLQIPR